LKMKLETLERSYGNLKKGVIGVLLKTFEM